jgi:hypothetical protein
LGYNALNSEHLEALGALVARLFDLLGKAVPGDPVEVAAGFIALGRGMALLSQHGDAGRIGRIVVTFLSAVIASAQPRHAEKEKKIGPGGKKPGVQT